MTLENPIQIMRSLISFYWSFVSVNQHYHVTHRTQQIHFWLKIRYWRNWYRVWRHGCDTTDSQLSPKPRCSQVCGDIWQSVASQLWPKTMYHILFYHGTTKSSLNKDTLSSQTAPQLPKFTVQGHCKHWVTKTDCFATHVNHYDVTAGLVSLNFIHAVDKNM